MEELVKGDVVSIPFPFSDLSGTKKRPCLVLAALEGDDIILCQITSQRSDTYAILLDSGDFSRGGLPAQSIVRPNKLFTAEKSIVIAKHGALHQRKLSEILNMVDRIFQNHK